MNKTNIKIRRCYLDALETYSTKAKQIKTWETFCKVKSALRVSADGDPTRKLQIGEKTKRLSGEGVLEFSSFLFARKELEFYIPMNKGTIQGYQLYKPSWIQLGSARWVNYYIQHALNDIHRPDKFPARDVSRVRVIDAFNKGVIALGLLEPNTL